MSQQKVNCLPAILGFLSLLISSNDVYALDEDKKKILTIAADSVDIRPKNHEGHYQGHIEFDQGTTHLRAEKAITYTNENNKLTKASAQGLTTPAHFWTLPKKGDAELHAYANEIIYDLEHHKIELIGNARIQQGENVFKAPKIILDTLTQHVVTEHDKRSRTKILIHPKDLPHDPTRG